MFIVHSITVGDQFGDEDDDSEAPLITGGSGKGPSGGGNRSPGSSMQSPVVMRRKPGRQDSDSDTRSVKSVKFLNTPG